MLCCGDAVAEQRQLLYQLCLLGRELHSQALSLPLELKVQNARGRGKFFHAAGTIWGKLQDSAMCVVWLLPRYLCRSVSHPSEAAWFLPGDLEW